MYDYYRLRFKHVLSPRRPISRGLRSGEEPVQMPRGLSNVAWVCMGLSGLGWAAAAAGGRSPIMGSSPVLAALVLLLPITLALAVGFSEEQSWTRPLLVLLQIVASGLAGLCGSVLMGVFLAGSALFSALYLYGHRETARYYRYLKDHPLISVSAEDLTRLEMLPFYSGLAGVAAGIVAAWLLVSHHLGYPAVPRNLDVHSGYGLVMVAVFFSAVLSFVGSKIGEALVSRLARAV